MAGGNKQYRKYGRDNVPAELLKLLKQEVNDAHD